jgi:hypothetical protein
MLIRACSLVLLLPTFCACSQGSSGNVSDAGACPHDLPDACVADAPSYSATVSLIIQKDCVYCHYANSPIAKFDFSTYAGVSTNQGPFLDQVYACNMPPADAAAFALTDVQRQELLEWLVCNAPDN